MSWSTNKAVITRYFFFCIFSIFPVALFPSALSIKIMKWIFRILYYNIDFFKRKINRFPESQDRNGAFMQKQICTLAQLLSVH